MKITCGVMNDLLPPYQEGLLGAESAQLVEEHLAECPHCTQALEKMRRADTPLPGAQAPLRAVGAKLKRDRWRRVGMAVALVVFLGTVLFYHATARQYLRYTPELVEIKEVSPGKLVVEGRGVTGIWSQVEDAPTQLEEDLGLLSGTEVYLAFFSNGAADSTTTFTTTFEDQGTLRVYYTYPGETAVQIYGPTSDEGVALLPRLALNYYWRLAVVVAAVLAVLLVLLYKKPAARRVIIALLCVPLCYVLAHFAIKGTSGASWDMTRDLAYILVAWAALTTAVQLALKQRRLAL